MGSINSIANIYPYSRARAWFMTTIKRYKNTCVPSRHQHHCQASIASCLSPSLSLLLIQCPVLVLSSEHFYNKLFDMWACEYWNILIHNHSTYMFYFYIFYLTYSVLHGAIGRLVYDTRFAFYAVALNYVLALFLFFYLYVCLGVLLIVYLFIIFYALIKSGKIAIQIWQVVADKCAQIFVKLARCRKSQMANPTMPPLGSSCCRSVITGLMVVVSWKHMWLFLLLLLFVQRLFNFHLSPAH